MIDFQSSVWADALRNGLGAIHHYGAGALEITCFQAGPFRLAYPDFFTGTASPVNEQTLQQYLHAAGRLKADVVRVQTHALQATSRPLASHIQTSCVISSLQDWDERSLDKARRTGNREKRSPLLLRKGTAEDGHHLHELYLATIRRHGGNARYGRQYFEHIAPHAATVAELDGRICGFVCTGMRNNTAYYMHGAHAVEARKHYVSDLLFLHMIRQAKAAGMASFDFLPSPANQPTLLAYKMLWGASPRSFNAHDFTLNPLRARALLLAIKAANFMSSQLRRHI